MCVVCWLCKVGWLVVLGVLLVSLVNLWVNFVVVECWFSFFEVILFVLVFIIVFVMILVVDCYFKCVLMVNDAGV